MAIDLLAVQPHKMSRDLRGYSVFLYGGWKTGKTTTACMFPNHLLLAFEKGYSAIPGAMAQPINDWREFKQVLKELKKDEVKEKFETIIIDTADIAYDYCTKYICNNNDVNTVSEIPYGKGYDLIAKEFDESLRLIVQLGYGLVIISHETEKTFKDAYGQDYLKIVPTLDKRANNIIARMCDILGYSRAVETDEGTTMTKLYMRGTPRFEAGSRFKYTPDDIVFTYDNLVNAIAEAVKQHEAELGKELFTNKREEAYKDTTSELDYDALMGEFQNLMATLEEKYPAEKMESFYVPRIQALAEKYLGKGNKISNCSYNQVQQLALIIDDIKDLIEKNK